MLEKSSPSLEIQRKISNIEDNIATKTAEKFNKKVKDLLGQYRGDDGAINTHGMWVAKNKLIPRENALKPVALKDIHGNFITNPDGIKNML